MVFIFMIFIWGVLLLFIKVSIIILFGKNLSFFIKILSMILILSWIKMDLFLLFGNIIWIVMMNYKVRRLFYMIFNLFRKVEK